ncbi:MAG: hypothetical protein EAZ85_12930 [Bacteroidetes bacterium]|nr:MAG: hypothetical protein EAZ85_12930 [Bacteroidota bacterium]TAG94165.1 MAG: hypothetical protein EAZ20_01115 [Bacteroidota bacterium]
MLTDYWIIAQFIAQIGSWLLLTYTTFVGIEIMRKWKKNSNTNLQINLERKTYLIGAVAYMVLVVQVFVLLFFLQTINQHLPTLIRGAMCATGTLQANQYGNLALYIKISSLIIYAIFLTLQYLDSKSPEFPLIPIKYYFLIPVWLFLSVDIVISFFYFSSLSPNIITTCCSVVFLGNEENINKNIDFNTSYLFEIIMFSVAIFLWLISYFIQKIYIIKCITSIFILYYSIFFLQHFFVKYIYGLPNHFCLFDMFFWEYNAIGFVWFGVWIAFAWAHIAEIVSFLAQKKLDFSIYFYFQYLKKIQLLSLIIFIFIPLFYYFSWNGEL